uniref:beta-N-acetylhexosaminidase n=1 Tax=Lethocerus distinctifemur TaxID=280095 RepID=A0A2K8JRH0_9HEMI|nr:venom hexosaminidase [Lethocerus distinctifemur]
MWSAALILVLTLREIYSLDGTARAQTCVGEWCCEKGKCLRNYDVPDGAYNSTLEEKYFEVCRLTCGKFSTVWPKPTRNIALSHRAVAIDPTKVSFDFEGVAWGQEARDFAAKCADVFKANLKKEYESEWRSTGAKPLAVSLNTITPDTVLDLDTDESYLLEISTSEDVVVVTINSSTLYGARHGLETLSQLVASYWEEDGRHWVALSAAKISDSPVYRYRGLLIDTARNYITLEAIRRTIDAMAASKLNVLHWHVTDSHSFPLVSPSVPELSRYGAYSPKEIYSPQDVKDLIEYSKYRGVRIILEIDTPSHSGYGWQWGDRKGLGDLAVCVNQQPFRQYCYQAPCGQLNPVNQNVYAILHNLYLDIHNMFDDIELFHMGGDEVSIPCWNTSSEITAWMESHNMNRDSFGFLKLWGRFQTKALAEWDEAAGHSNTKIILWSSLLTSADYITQFLDNKRYIIETWVDQDDILPHVLLEKGYELIVATKDAWYLDHGFWGKTTYHNWMVAYDNKLPPGKGVLGGEVALWGELVADGNLDGRMWPRGAAAAERLWADPASAPAAAHARLIDHSRRMNRRGIRSSTIAPRWCYQNEAQCD